MVERGKVPQSKWLLISQQAVIFLALFVLRQKEHLVGDSVNRQRKNKILQYIPMSP